MKNSRTSESSSTSEAPKFFSGPAEEQLDLVADHGGVRRARHDRVRVVVTGQGKRRDDDGVINPNFDSSVTCRKVRTEPTPRSRDASSRRWSIRSRRREQRDDEERQVAVGEERHHDGERVAESQETGATPKIPSLVHVAVVLQQVDPGEHAGDVVDPPRREDQRQDQTAPLPGQPSGVVRHGVSDADADHQRPERVDRGADPRPGRCRRSVEITWLKVANCQSSGFHAGIGSPKMLMLR